MLLRPSPLRKVVSPPPSPRRRRRRLDQPGRVPPDLATYFDHQVAQPGRNKHDVLDLVNMSIFQIFCVLDIFFIFDIF